MRILPLLSLAAILIFGSCSKDDDNMPCEPTVNGNVNTNYAPMTIGNYWIYNKYNKYPDGSIELSGQDSVAIIGDTLINGFSYFQHVAYRNGGPNSEIENRLYRDSSNYLVDNSGTIHFSPTDTSDSLAFEVEDFPGFTVWFISSMDLIPEEISVNAGTFNCLAYSTRIETDQAVIQDAFPKFNITSYAENVGRVRFNLNYSGADQQIIYELNSYHLE